MGYFYLRKGSTAAALGRFIQVEQRYPDYAAKDKLYYYQAVALDRLGRKEEARSYFGRVVEEFPQSSYARRARSKMGAKTVEKAPAAAVVVDTKPENQ